MNLVSKVYLPIAYLLPIILLLWFVATFGVNVPYLDQWSLLGFFDKVATGSANFKDFFEQHNEHRMFFPKIIFLILDFPSKWNTKLEMYFSVFLAVVSFYAMYKISAISKGQNCKLFHIFNIATCILTFSLVQYENWLWGFQIAWFLINTCVILAIFFLVVPKKLLTSHRLLLSAICCLIASFSSAHGLLSWIALIPTVASIKSSNRQRNLRLIIWLSLFALSFIIYQTNYNKPDYHPDIFFFLKKPLIAGIYLLNILGQSFGRDIISSAVITLIILLIFILFNIFYIKDFHSELAHDTAPWLSVGWFGTLFALITTLGRAGFGVGQSVAPRYTSVTILLVISVLQMWRLLILYKQQELTKNVYLNFGTIFFVGILTVNFISNNSSAIKQARETWVQRTRGEACLELINFIDKSLGDKFDNCFKLLYSDPAIVRDTAKILEKLAFRDFPDNVTFRITPTRDYGFIETPATTNTPLIVPKNGSIQLAGWAILPERREQPKIVFLSYGSNQLFFADAVVKLDRPDVAKALNSSLYRQSGWDTAILPSLMPLGETVIKAWVYDPEGKQFVKLIGEPKVKVVE